MSGRLVALVLALYPPAWRRRYGAELADLVARDGTSSWLRLVADLVAGASGEWLGVAGLVGDRTTARDRAVGSLARVVWSSGAFVVGLIALQKAQEQWPYHPSPVEGGALVDANVTSVTAVLVVVGGLAAAGALVAPALVAALRAGGWRRIRRPAIVAAIGSFVIVAIGAGIVTWAHQLDSSARNGGNAAYAAAVAVWVLTGLAVGGAWCVCIARLVRAAMPGRRAGIGAAWLAVAVGVSMVIASVASAIPYVLMPGPPTNGVLALAAMGVASLLTVAGAVPGIAAAHRVA
jgi:hypothetical protein